MFGRKYRPGKMFGENGALIPDKKGGLMFGLRKKVKALQAANKIFAQQETEMLEEISNLKKQVWNLKRKLQKVEEALK